VKNAEEIDEDMAIAAQAHYDLLLSRPSVYEGQQLG
jgi:hypothetical protein